nr:hypothetical protein [Tanacetum cinerariifolium]
MSVEDWMIDGRLWGLGGHNKDIVVEDLMNHMDKKDSFHCSPVPTHKEAGTEADNHNQIENHFHKNHTSESRMWGVEDGRSRKGNRKNSDWDHK